jgi:putative intracellular protease/amidase
MTATTTSNRLRLLHGSDAPLPALRVLQAGPARVLLDGIDLRYVSIERTELVRRIYVAVRDRNWNTIPGEVSGLELDARDDSFDLRFSVRHEAPDIDFSWQGAISGHEDGRITYGLDGVAEKDLQYNRIGICVHHPWRETAGAPFRARTPEGEIEGRFPDLVGPQLVEDGLIRALFPAFDRLHVELPAGGSLELEFEGDLWETEDHRNWTDANFKTYSTPLALGFPHDLAHGQTLAQRVTITPRDVTRVRGGDGATRLSIGRPTGTTVPAIGLGADGDGHEPSEREVELLRALGPAHLRVEVELDGDEWPDVLRHAQETARRVGANLLVSLHLRPEHADRLPAVAAALAGGPAVEDVLVILLGGRTSTPEETTPPELVALVRRAFADALPVAAIGGGTEIYFTEINRTRPKADDWDLVCFSITPQIHAFTDLDLVENLDAQAENIRSAKALAPGKQIVVSPITIRRRVNFHAAAPEPEPGPGELPDSVDVRQPSLLGGAWTAGSLKYVCEAGAAAVTYYETTGWRGVLEREGGSRLADRFHSRPGQVFPLYHPLADVAAWRGAEVLHVDSENPLLAVALAVQVDGAVRLLVANVTPDEQHVVVSPLQGALSLRRLGAASAEAASAEPASFRAGGEHAEADGELALRLEPYEVVRIDPIVGARPGTR